MPGALSVGQVSGEDGRLWVMAGVMTPYGRLQCLIDPLEVAETGAALVRFAELDQLAEGMKPELIIPEIRGL